MKLENKMDLLLENWVSIFVHIHFHSWMYIRQFVASNSKYVKPKIRNWKINRWKIMLSTLKCATDGRFAISSLFKSFSLRLREKNKTKQNESCRPFDLQHSVFVTVCNIQNLIDFFQAKKCWKKDFYADIPIQWMSLKLIPIHFLWLIIDWPNDNFYYCLRQKYNNIESWPCT